MLGKTKGIAVDPTNAYTNSSLLKDSLKASSWPEPASTAVNDSILFMGLVAISELTKSIKGVWSYRPF